jgi:hypothetical protein
LVDEFLPVFDVSDEIRTVVAADVATTWGALTDADLIEVGQRRPLVAAPDPLRDVLEEHVENHEQIVPIH